MEDGKGLPKVDEESILLEKGRFPTCIVDRLDELERCVRCWGTAIDGSDFVRLWLAEVEINFPIRPVLNMVSSAKEDVGRCKV
jgi:hypothetical protein